jgi:antitoxin ParD1/3/4
MAAAVRAKVASGGYATESEVIREGLRSLIARDQAIETSLREQVISAAVALEADPSRALTPVQIREHLAQKRRTRKGKVLAMSFALPQRLRTSLTRSRNTSR